MGQASNLRDFMVIARATGEAQNFHKRIKQAMRIAADALPQIAWRADFDLGPREHVDVISAPDLGSARKVVAVVTQLDGVNAELALLRKPW